MLCNKKLILSVFLLSSSTAFSGTMGEARACSDLSCMPWFLEIGSGASWSNNADISVDYSRYDRSPEGYNSKLGTVPVYMAGVGYKVSPLLTLDANYNFRGIYNYSKFQTSVSNGALNPLGDKTRYFNLTSNSIMFNGTINGKGVHESLVKDLNGHGSVQPFVGGGLGVSYNTVSNFHTKLANSNISTVLQDQTRASFAWQLNAGIEWSVDRFSLDLGYRYFNAGTFVSNDALITRLNSAGTPINTNTIPKWTGQLSSNELFLTAKIAF